MGKFVFYLPSWRAKTHAHTQRRKSSLKTASPLFWEHKLVSFSFFFSCLLPLCVESPVDWDGSRERYEDVRMAILLLSALLVRTEPSPAIIATSDPITGSRVLATKKRASLLQGRRWDLKFGFRGTPSVIDGKEGDNHFFFHSHTHTSSCILAHPRWQKRQRKGVEHK